MKKLAAVAAVIGLTCMSATALAQRGGERPQRGDRASQRQGNQPLHVADRAPEFALKSLDGKSETDITQFRGKRPLILFFGSYT